MVRQTNVKDTNRHLIALQRISDTNGGNRAAPDAEREEAPGYDASVAYVADQLRRRASSSGHRSSPTRSRSRLAASLTVGGTAYRIDKMTESIDTPAGGITGPIAGVPEDATTGCEATDFAGQDFTGAVALIRRGGCTFEQKSPTPRPRAQSPP